MSGVMQDPVILWLAAGAFVIALEAFTYPGLGLFLLGIGAFVTAAGIKTGLIGADALGAQYACCFLSAALATALCWKPLKRFRVSRVSAQGAGLPSNNLIGGIAVVAEPGLAPGFTGQVVWSGTRMSAELAASAPIALPPGAKVVILSVSGNLLTVIPQL